MRGVDQLVAAPQALVAHPLFHDLAHHGAFGVPEDESGAGNFLNGEEVELLAQNAMIAFGCFLQPGKVLLHFLAGEEGGAVDAL